VAYATVEDFRALTGHLDIDLPEGGSDDAIERLLQRASDDISQFLAFPARPPGAPDNPSPPLPDRIPDMDAFELRALSTATIVQAAYRLARGEDDLLEGPPSVIAAGGITFAAAAPAQIGGGTLYALSGCPSLWWARSGTVTPDEPTAA
jgi:hypothetical protein